VELQELARLVELINTVLVAVLVVEPMSRELMVLFFLAVLVAVAVAVVQPFCKRVCRAVRVRFMVAVEAVALLVALLHQALAVMAVVAVLKFTHGDKYEQICTYKQSKYC
jgi:hypothetical protein